MNDASTRETIARVYREESARALATLIRLLGEDVRRLAEAQREVDAAIEVENVKRPENFR